MFCSSELCCRGSGSDFSSAVRRASSIARNFSISRGMAGRGLGWLSILFTPSCYTLFVYALHGSYLLALILAVNPGGSQNAALERLARELRGHELVGGDSLALALFSRA